MQESRIQKSSIIGCPTRPECPVCGMRMVTTGRMFEGEEIQCDYECLRCGHAETSQLG
jgi:hypothetical protein